MAEKERKRRDWFPENAVIYLGRQRVRVVRIGRARVLLEMWREKPIAKDAGLVNEKSQQ